MTSELNQEALEAALEAAAKVYASQNRREPPTPSDIEGTAEDLRSPINAFLAVADLVPRRRLAECQDMRDRLKAQATKNRNERDEARRETAATHLSAQERAQKIATQGAQIAALREPSEINIANGVQFLIDAKLDGPDGVGHSDALGCWHAMFPAVDESEPKND